MHRRYPLLVRLSLTFLLAVSVPVGALAGLSYYLQHSIRLDMEERVETTLDMAINVEESLLREGLADMRQAASAAAADPRVADSLLGEGRAPADLRRFQKAFPLADMLLLVDTSGTVHARLTSEHTGDKVLLNGLVAYALSSGEAQAFPTLIEPAELQSEGPSIQQMVDMAILETRYSSDPRAGRRVDTALALAGVAPVRSPAGDVVGAVIAADVLNRDFRIVDEVASWAPGGTPLNATIAMDGVRITTNVPLRDPEGNPYEYRAVGTLYSDAVMHSLSVAGVHRGRAPVVNQWQRTIYRAMKDYQGRMIAAPYVGIPESYFATVGNKLTRSLQVAVAAGSGILIAALLAALWLTYRGIVRPLRGLAHGLAGEAASRNDEIGDLARAMQDRSQQWVGAVRQLQATGEQLSAAVDRIQAKPFMPPEQKPEVPAAAGLRTGAEGALEQLQQLEQAVRSVTDGVRTEERSIAYVGRVVHEIAVGLDESRSTVEAALTDVGELTASARAALKHAGEFAAGMAFLRRSLIAASAQPGLDLMRDPSELLASLATLSERVAGEVRTLVLIIQENQARLAFIREEMHRVGGIVQSTAGATQEASRTANEAVRWMEGVASSTMSVADEVIAARTAFDEAAQVHRDLNDWCSEIAAQIGEFRRILAELEHQG
ncbi:MAG TPA: methyl-accepting chemotaxis protein [Symbiobacteriaceae bacterium]|nr:methyl-accepting chemotaxis protein [Symbiobacteriaceae bacterium]